MARLPKLAARIALVLGAVALPGLAAFGGTSAAAAGVYVVAQGDTLIGIARAHGVPLDVLLSANGLTSTSVIHPGQQLAIPDAPAVASGATYTVVAGDTLSGIASRNGVRLAHLLEVNGLSVNSVIQPGDVLDLPAGGRPTSAASGAAGSGSGSSGVSTGDARIDAVVNYALAQVGKPYVFFTKGSATFDCSGLTLAAYRQVGVDLVHHSVTQAQQGALVDHWNTAIRAGDLVFLDTDWDGVIDHVGMATSSTTWVHASQTRDAVVTGSLPSDSVIITVRRMLG
jgi:peptidoglycan endopeptidase LytE